MIEIGPGRVRRRPSCCGVAPTCTPSSRARRSRVHLLAEHRRRAARGHGQLVRGQRASRCRSRPRRRRDLVPLGRARDRRAEGAVGPAARRLDCDLVEPLLRPARPGRRSVVRSTRSSRSSATSRAPPSSIPGRRSTGLPVLREAGFEDVAAERFPWDGRADARDDIVALFSTFSNMRLRPDGRAASRCSPGSARVADDAVRRARAPDVSGRRSTPAASPAAERQPAWLTLSTALTMPS